MSELESAVRAASERDLPRAALSAAIVARLEELGAPPESIAAARRIAEPRSVVVVAGQQPVLLGGPGLVWAKADDALGLAEQIEREQSVPAVAVFWNASEDHDHAEVDHVRMDLGGEPETLRVPLPGDRRMLSRVAVPAVARALVDLVRTKLPPGVERDSAAVAPDDSMGSWFSRILLRRLGARGLVVVEPETLRPFARGVVDFELDRPGELAASIRRAESESASLGLTRDELFFLLDDAGRRLRVTLEDGAWNVEDGRELTTAQMRALPPAAFSWNVAARVLAQDLALPVAAQVCGPSEIRYAGLLREAHAFLGVPQSALRLRTSIVFVTPRMERLCRDLGVNPWTVARDGEAALPMPAPPSEPPGLAAARAAIAELPREGSAAVQRRHAGLVQGIEAYAEALRRDASERDGVQSSRRAKLLAWLRPEGEGQDRRFSPLPWFARLSGDPEVHIDPGTQARTLLFRTSATRNEPE